MGIGDVERVTVGDCEDVWLLDSGMFDTAEYGGVYILDGGSPAIVETGTGANVDRILAALEEIDIEPGTVGTIAVTHVHLDHAGGAGALADRCPNASVVVSERGAPHLADPERLVAGTKAAVGAQQWRHYADPVPIAEDRLLAVGDGDAIDIAGRTMQVHRAPGHAPHQVILESPADDVVFTGDAAGIWLPSANTVAETTPPPQFDLEQCLRDVDTIAGLDRAALLYTHFGPRETDGVLDEYRRVLADWVERVEQLYKRHGDEEAVLAALEADPERVSVWGEEKARAEQALNVRGVLASIAG